VGSRVVHLAVFRGYLDVVSFLVEVGANPNQLLTETGKTVKTVLHLAAQGGHVDIVRFLKPDPTGTSVRQTTAG